MDERGERGMRGWVGGMRSGRERRDRVGSRLYERGVRVCMMVGGFDAVSCAPEGEEYCRDGDDDEQCIQGYAKYGERGDVR